MFTPFPPLCVSMNEIGFVFLLLLDARHGLFDDLFHPVQRLKVFRFKM